MVSGVRIFQVTKFSGVVPEYGFYFVTCLAKEF